MIGIHETAYPRLKQDFTEQELKEIYTPTVEERLFVTRQYRQATHRAYLLIQLKLLQRLGYFISLATIPKILVEHICSSSSLRTPLKTELIRYDQSGSKSVHQKLLRTFVSILPLDSKGELWLQKQAVDAAKTKHELADIINVMIEALVQQRYELPGFTFIYRLARKSRAKANEQLFNNVFNKLSKSVIVRLDQINENRINPTVWDSLKREAKRPKVKEINDFLKHVNTMICLSEEFPVIEEIAETKRHYLVTEARALDLAELRQLKPLKRYTLILLLIQSQLQKALDQVAEIVIKTVRNLHNTGEERLRQYQLEKAERVVRLIGQFKEVLIVLDSDGDSDERLSRIKTSLNGNYQGLIIECEENMAYAGNNYYPFLLSGYAGKRNLLFKCLEILSLKSSSQDDILLKAVALIKQNRSNHRDYIEVVKNNATEFSFEWLSDKWQRLVGVNQQAENPVVLHKKYFELAVFSQVMKELKTGDLYVEQSDEYDDYREHLVSWEEFDREVEQYSELVGFPIEEDNFVNHLQRKLQNLAKKVDQSFPENTYVDIEESELILRKAEKVKPVKELALVDQAIKSQMKEASIIEVLTETERWLDLHRLFGPLSGFERKIDDPRKRFIITLFCYGCNLGPSQTAKSVKGISRKQVAWLNLKHVTEDRLDKAIIKVINAYNRFALPHYWGSGKSASADGTKWNIYEKNLLSEYHIRYGGYGGIGYYHVSDKYIALFSHFIPCGVYEAIYILDGLIKNTSDIQPDTIHGDTQAQSTPVFGLAYLLGIDLMPRIRNIKDLKFFKSDKNDQYQHIGSLFRGVIDWGLIDRHLKDMLRVVISIKAGKIAPSTILRRLGSASRKNKLYYAFRELGRVVRTLFLLKYINDVELRKTINAETNKSEEFNDFVQWLFFGGEGIIAENIRHEQRKVIKYNHLVANMVILHNVQQMTQILKNLENDAYALNDAVLKGLAPYRRQHINRFGEYSLELDREVEPLNYNVKFDI